MGVQELDLDISVLEAEVIDGVEVIPHPNGGGFVATTAIVEPSVFVGPQAFVGDYARVYGNVKLMGKSEISGHATVSGNVLLAKDAVITDRAMVSGTVKIGDQVVIKDNAIVRGKLTLMGQTEVKDNAVVDGEFHLLGNTTVMVGAYLRGRAALTDCILAASADFPVNIDVLLKKFKITNTPTFFSAPGALIIRADDAVFLNGQRYDDEDLMWDSVTTDGPAHDALFTEYRKIMRCMVELT